MIYRDKLPCACSLRCISTKSNYGGTYITSKTPFDMPFMIRTTSDVAASMKSDLAQRDHVLLARDPSTDEWVLEFSPQLDLLELARLLGCVQQQTLELLHDQIVKQHLGGGN